MGAFSRAGETQSFEEKEPQEHTRGKMACCPIFLYFIFYFDLTFQLTVLYRFWVDLLFSLRSTDVYDCL